MDQPDKVANNPARGQLKKENEYFPVPVRALRIWSRETSSVVPSRVSLLISILRLNLVLTYGISATASIYPFKPLYAIGSVPSLLGNAIA